MQGEAGCDAPGGEGEVALRRVHGFQARQHYCCRLLLTLFWFSRVCFVLVVICLRRSRFASLSLLRSACVTMPGNCLTYALFQWGKSAAAVVAAAARCRRTSLLPFAQSRPPSKGSNFYRTCSRGNPSCFRRLDAPREDALRTKWSSLPQPQEYGVTLCAPVFFSSHFRFSGAWPDLLPRLLPLLLRQQPPAGSLRTRSTWLRGERRHRGRYLLCV